MTKGLWIATGICLVFLLFFGLGYDLRKEGDAMAIVAVLGLMTPILGFGALYMTLTARKFGDVVLHLYPTRGIVGGEMTGHIIARKFRLLSGGAQIKLKAVDHIRTSSGTKSGHVSKTVFETAVDVPAHSIIEHGGEIHIPVCIPIPDNAPPSGGEDRVEWMLECRASLPGLDFYAVFTVPVGS